MKIPFMFRVVDGDTPHSSIDKWVVVLANWDYKTINGEWMCWPLIGNYPLTPEVDFFDEKDVFEFDSESAALAKVKELWANVQV